MARYVLLSNDDFELLEQIKQQQLVEHYQRVLNFWANNPLKGKK